MHSALQEIWMLLDSTIVILFGTLTITKLIPQILVVLLLIHILYLIELMII